MENQTNPTINRSNLPLPERIKLIVQDENFRQYCVREHENNYFMQYFSAFLKLAQIDISKIKIDRSMFDYNYNPEEVHNETVNFYKWLDRLCPQMPLAEASDNLKQIVTYDQSSLPEQVKQLKPRAGCGHIIENGQLVNSWIFLENKSDIRDALTSAHEYGHAHSKHFLTGKPFKDPAMGEFVPVMIDELSLYSLELKTGNEKLCNEVRKSRITLCVEKARKCVLQHLVVQVMAQDVTPQEKLNLLSQLQQQYKHIISERELFDCISEIEQNKFQPMFEAKYIFAQLASMQLSDKLQQIKQIKKNGTPEQVQMAVAEEQKVVATLKQVLAHDTELTVDEAIKMFGFPPKEVMVDNYSDRVSGQAKQTN